MRLFRCALCGSVVGILMLVGGIPASAHAELRQSEPERGASVDAVPDEVTASFTEPLSDSSSLQIFDACRDRVDTGGVTIDGQSISARVDSTAAGRYEVRFFVISDLDGHPTRGSFTFDVSAGTSCASNAGDGGGTSGGGMFDIPLGDFLMALGFAALIGAAGGHVYAGILGKRS